MLKKLILMIEFNVREEENVNIIVNVSVGVRDNSENGVYK